MSESTSTRHVAPHGADPRERHDRAEGRDRWDLRNPAERFSVRGWFLLITLCGATFMVGLDYSIV
ncbi:MAG TPA: hypothetical protein VHH34_10250, partial [Pseudonocardiaceae bacterium]|nr:hypothetical protein [Pseudonocardiaceae bacterium]